MNDSGMLDGKIALITGAGGGIGRASAVLAAAAGAKAVVVADIQPAAAEETAHLVEGMGATAVAMAIDVSDPDLVETMLEGTCREFGRLDAAFNNAGILQKAGLMADAETSEWDQVMQVNAKGVWLCMRAEIRRMLDRKRGSIVNTASVAGLRAIAMQAIYTASKHAVAGLTRNAAVDYAASGLRINAVCPGGIHRSEEHTSELQSLMRISYAVFCLKKQK